MKDEERKGLLEFGRELHEAEQSRWQPGCVSRAFSGSSTLSSASRWPWQWGPLTMQQWIDLDAVRSCFLIGTPIEEGRVLIEIANAVSVLCGDVVTPEMVQKSVPPADAVALIAEIKQTISLAFATAVKLEPPHKSDTPAADDGFGTWLTILGCATETGIPMSAVLTERVDRLLALSAVRRKLQGWRVVGSNYRTRDAQ